MTLGLGAYLIWGLLPIFFKQLAHVDPFEVVAQRIIWSLVIMAPVVFLTGNGSEFLRIVRTPRLLAILTCSALIIAVNWTGYVAAVVHGHVLAASLGYFLSPLINVILGRLIFSEQVSARQWMAVALAGLGTALLAMGALDTLWISLLIAGSWAVYSVIRKLAPIGPVAGLAIETLLLTPLALAYVVWLHGQGGLSFGMDGRTTGLLVFSGVLTSLPLLLFTMAAKKAPLSLLGLLQYIAPTIQFLCAALIYAEPLNGSQLACFGLIWAALALFVSDTVAKNRRLRPAQA